MSKDPTKSKKKESGPIEAKVVLLGDSGVSKTALSTKYSEGYFPEETSVTLGGSYCKKACELENGSKIIMHIWDTAGSESSRAMLPLYYRDSTAGLITYDIGNMKSFEHLDYWSNELSQKLKPGSFTIAIVGNKADLPEEDREVPHIMGYQYAREKNYLFQETSAKEGTGITEIFQQVAQEIYDIKMKEAEK